MTEILYTNQQEIFTMMDFLRTTAIAVPQYSQPWPEEIVRSLGVLSHSGDFIFYRDGTLKFDGWGHRTPTGLIVPPSEVDRVKNTQIDRVVILNIRTPISLLPRIHHRLRGWTETRLRDLSKRCNYPSMISLLLKLYKLDFLHDYMLF